MTLYLPVPRPVLAVQFTGDNWAEMFAFCGIRLIDDTTPPRATPIFTKMGTYCLDYLTPWATAELYVAEWKAVRPVAKGQWIVKNDLGFQSYTDEYFRTVYRSADGVVADAKEIEQLLEDCRGEWDAPTLMIQALTNAGYRLVKEA